jgi:hypothetical protein
MSRRRDGIHRAEALIAAGDWYAAVGPTLVAHNISRLCAPGLLDPSASQGTT